MESRIDRMHAEQMMDHYQGAIIAALSMSVNDFVVRCDVSGGAFAVTLPPVVEATGKLYTIKIVADAAAGAAPNNLTITTKGTAPNKDAIRWNGDIVLSRAGDSVVLFSDGEEWHRMLVSDGKPIHHTKHVHEMFELPFVSADVLDGGTPSTTTENCMICASGNVFSIMGIVGQTLSGPAWDNPGIDLAMDQVENDGVEMTSGIGAGNPVQFTVGTDPAFFFKVRMTLTDVSGNDVLVTGLRKREAFQADYNAYDEMAGLNMVSGDIKIETILNNAATTVTDTTDNWGDAETHTLKILVSAAGVVTYEIDDAAPTATAAFTFDTGEVVIPFISMLQDANLNEGIIILEWECGYQA